MASEEEKGIVEVSVFSRFAAAAGLNCEAIEKQSPEEGKPDLKCLLDGRVTYFELTEACSEDLAKAIANSNRDDPSLLLRVKDYTSETYRKKINKRYAVSDPVELLIYNLGRTILPDAVLIDNIRAISRQDKGQFRRVWYFGQQLCEL